MTLALEITSLLFVPLLHALFENNKVTSVFPVTHVKRLVFC